MANDLVTLTTRLTQALRDADHAAWNQNEKEDLITWAVASLWPSFGRYLDPSANGQEVTLVSGTIFYTLPTGMLTVHSIDRMNTDETEEYGPIVDNSWQVTGDPMGGTAKLRVAPVITEQGGKLRLHGYGQYDTATNLIPDRLVPLVLAIARAEAYRRVGADRARFKQYQTANPEVDTSMNELLLQINEADAEAFRLRSMLVEFRRPAPGRLG